MNIRICYIKLAKHDTTPFQIVRIIIYEDDIWKFRNICSMHSIFPAQHQVFIPEEPVQDPFNVSLALTLALMLSMNGRNNNQCSPSIH